MEAEARLIIGLSMNKIMSSRTRRGGASLHRNLLIASVMVKARTFYLESAAAAEQRRSASAVVDVTPPLPVNSVPVELPAENEQVSIDDVVEDMDTTAALPKVPASLDVGLVHDGTCLDSGCSREGNNLTCFGGEVMIIDSVAQQLVDNALCPESSGVVGEQLIHIDTLPVSGYVFGSGDRSGSGDTDVEQYKENVAPQESTVTPRRKRGYTEVESAVISIGGRPEVTCDVNNDIADCINDNKEDVDHGYSSYSNRSNSSCGQNDINQPCLKRLKLDLVDISTVSRSVMKKQSSYNLDINLHVVTGGRSVGSSCGGPVESVYSSFTSNGSSLRSPPMLMGTV